MKRACYPHHWPALALACKERAGWRCEGCGLAHGTELVSRRTGKCYRVALHTAEARCVQAVFGALVSVRHSVEAFSRSTFSSIGCCCSSRGELWDDRHAVLGTFRSQFPLPIALCSSGVESFEPMPRRDNRSV